jgi:hypothetical protein
MALGNSRAERRVPQGFFKTLNPAALRGEAEPSVYPNLWPPGWSFGRQIVHESGGEAVTARPEKLDWR